MFWRQVEEAPDPIAKQRSAQPRDALALTLMTANVGSFSPAEEWQDADRGRMASARRDPINSQIAGHAPDLIGIQEARGRTAF